MARITKAERERSLRAAEQAFWHCPDCETVFVGRQTVAVHLDMTTWARECPNCNVRVRPLKDEEVDLGIVDYLAV